MEPEIIIIESIIHPRLKRIILIIRLKIKLIIIIFEIIKHILQNDFDVILGDIKKYFNISKIDQPIPKRTRIER